MKPDDQENAFCHESALESESTTHSVVSSDSPQSIPVRFALVCLSDLKVRRFHHKDELLDAIAAAHLRAAKENANE